jgi:hypothetical protein
MSYPGASTTQAFTATEPYVLNIQGTPTTVSLGGASRSHDFSGTIPFVNAVTKKNDPLNLQAWSWSNGLIDWYGSQITNSGVPGRIDKTTFGSDAVTLIKYNAGDNIAFEKCRSKLASFSVPPRTHVRWELEVAFGKADGTNDWVLTPTWQSPVLFWQLRSSNQSNPPLAMNVDTDNLDATKLMITVFQRTGTDTKPIELSRVHGLSRHTLIPIAMEAFLDERTVADGGKGIWQVWVNNKLVLEDVGPTLSLGPKTHEWSIETYLWMESYPYKYNRATFYKTARMLVFPTGLTATKPIDVTAPSTPSSLAATSPDPSKANLSWSASTDNVGVTGYKIYRNNSEIGTSATTSFTDSSTVEATIYNYTVKAYDNAGNFSASSNTATVTTQKTSINISSFYVNNITTTSAIANWTTNFPSTGSVYYGKSSSNLNSSVTDSVLKTSLSKQIKGLVRGTTYYYKIIAWGAPGTNLTTTSPISSFTTAK